MNNNATSLSRTEAIFHAVLSAPKDLRGAVLRSECAGDERLMEDVQSLLDASEEEERLTAARLTEAKHPSATADAARQIGTSDFQP